MLFTQDFNKLEFKSHVSEKVKLQPAERNQLIVISPFNVKHFMVKAMQVIHLVRNLIKNVVL